MCFVFLQCDIQLDRKVLTDLAIYEPRTFKVRTFNSNNISIKNIFKNGLVLADYIHVIWRIKTIFIQDGSFVV